MSVWIPLVAVTAFWLVIGIGGPLLVPRGPNKGKLPLLLLFKLIIFIYFSGIIQTMIVLTAVCCHLFWIVVYLHQLNPLIGPQIPVRTILWLAEKWGSVDPNLQVSN